MSIISLLLEEIFLRIFGLLTPESIRSCSQVCHLFRTIIGESAHLQYLLELDICGYAEPPRTRLDLTYADKLDILRDHRARWNNLGNLSPTEYELNSDEHGVTYEYAGGIYVRGVPHAESDRLTRRLYFYQLPSRNRGTGYKDWCISDLGVDTRDFGVCPEQDLLVLLEIKTLRTEGLCHVHLRSMATNEPHPKAKPGRSTLTYNFKPLSEELPPDRSFYFEISGHLLAILFRSRTRSLPSYVVIWDWTTGEELSCVRTVGGWNASFTLLSENSFVLPRFSKSYDAEAHVPQDTFGSLDVYRFDNLSTEAKRVASFKLPPLGRKHGESTVQIRCSPTTIIPNSQAYLNSPPKIYDLAPLDRLLCIDVHRTPIQGAGFAESAGTLFVPSSVLLNASSDLHHTQLNDRDCLDIEWSSWASKVSWADTRNFRTGNECYMFGQRTIAFQNTPTDQAIIILDFDPRRLKARCMAGVEAQGEVCSPGDGSLVRIKEFTGKAAFCSEEAPASRRYVRTTFMADEEQDVDFWDTVMIDDEHIVVKKIRQEGKFSLLVYNF